jgi:hypothetical protein
LPTVPELEDVVLFNNNKLAEVAKEPDPFAPDVVSKLEFK